MKTENNLTEGNVLQVLLAFSVPFLIANIIQALYGAVDLMVIGRFCSPDSYAEHCRVSGIIPYAPVHIL